MESATVQALRPLTSTAIRIGKRYVWEIRKNVQAKFPQTNQLLNLRRPKWLPANADIVTIGKYTDKLTNTFV